MIEKALGPENLDEVFLLSKRFLSENATKDSKPASGDPRHEKLSTYQLPFPPPPSYLHLRNLSAKNRQTERRLAFENQIQKAFLEKETSTTEKIERIMQQFDKHRGPLEGENDDYCEVIEEHEPEQPPAPPSAERGDPGMLRTEDKIGDEIRRLERKQYDLRLRREQQAGDYAKGAVRHEVETQGTYREKQQNPDLSSNEPNLSRRDEEYTRLVNSYRADAITRGLSLKQINTLLDKIEVGTLAYKTHFLHTLLKRSRAKEQKEVTWSNVPTSRPQPEERSPRPEASPGPGILRRESTFYPRSPRSFDPLQDYYPDDVMIQRDAVIVD